MAEKKSGKPAPKTTQAETTAWEAWRVPRISRRRGTPIRRSRAEAGGEAFVRRCRSLRFWGREAAAGS